jgi:hypothetical protein
MQVKDRRRLLFTLSVVVALVAGIAAEEMLAAQGPITRVE